MLPQNGQRIGPLLAYGYTCLKAGCFPRFPPLTIGESHVFREGIYFRPRLWGWNCGGRDSGSLAGRCLCRLDGSMTGMWIALWAIVQNEIRSLVEWLEHYKSLGFSDFLIYDNEGTDGTSEVLQALDEA